MGEYTVFGVAGLQPGLTLKRSEIGCGSVRKVVVSTVANHNHGCGERGYSLVRANMNGETENMRNLQSEQSFIRSRRMRSRSTYITNRKSAMQTVKLLENENLHQLHLLRPTSNNTVFFLLEGFI
jgi:hypothetical protein